mgnify:CR=1 FL=1
MIEIIAHIYKQNRKNDSFLAPKKHNVATCHLVVFMCRKAHLHLIHYFVNYKNIHKLDRYYANIGYIVDFLIYFHYRGFGDVKVKTDAL